MVQEAINERIAKGKGNKENSLVEKIVQNIPEVELKDFVIRTAQYNPTLTQALLLEFSLRQRQTNEKIDYSEIIRTALSEVDIDVEDFYYGEQILEIDPLDDWLKKGKEYADQGKYSEAVSIAKACLEEFAEWFSNESGDLELYDYVSEDYIYMPFAILTKAKENNHISAEALLEYAQEEIKKTKYRRSRLSNPFNNFIMELIEETDPNAYLKTLENQFEKLSDKTSYQAKVILTEIIDFHNSQNENEKAWEIVRNNIRIESFRKQVVEKLITEQQFKEAKKLINDYIKSKMSEKSYYANYSSDWDKLLLDIAQKENDIHGIRENAKRLIEDRFILAFYTLYKSTFQTEEWAVEMEKLIKQYGKDSRFSYDAADLLVEEKLTERLLKYMEQGSSSEVLRKYYLHLAPDFPGRTIALFKKTIRTQLESTGRDTYEHAVLLFEDLLKVQGGEKEVLEMIGQYKVLYKNRKAMIEIFDRFYSKHLRK
jgi:hypothetical protein